MNTDENEENDTVPEEMEESAKRTTLDLLPTKSKQQYEITYSPYLVWRGRKNLAGRSSESVLLTYFEKKSKIWKSLTLWSNYSIIKAMTSIPNNQDISEFYQVLA